jgi:hypothetical protein
MWIGTHSVSLQIIMVPASSPPQPRLRQLQGSSGPDVSDHTHCPCSMASPAVTSHAEVHHFTEARLSCVPHICSKCARSFCFCFVGANVVRRARLASFTRRLLSKLSSPSEAEESFASPCSFVPSAYQLQVASSSPHTRPQERYCETSRTHSPSMCSDCQRAFCFCATSRGKEGKHQGEEEYITPTHGAPRPKRAPPSECLSAFAKRQRVSPRSGNVPPRSSPPRVEILTSPDPARFNAQPKEPRKLCVDFPSTPPRSPHPASPMKAHAALFPTPSLGGSVR